MTDAKRTTRLPNRATRGRDDFRDWVTIVWRDRWPFTTRRAASREARNAFELGYDAGEARLRERIGRGEN